MLRWRFPDSSSRGWPAAAAALLWALAAASVVLWWLHMPQAAGPAVPPASFGQESPPAQVSGAAARALGHVMALPASADAQKRFQLLGVIATRSGQGSALVSVDGQPAQAFVRGQQVADGWQLQSVQDNSVQLISLSSGAPLELTLPQQR